MTEAVRRVGRSILAVVASIAGTRYYSFVEIDGVTYNGLVRRTKEGGMEYLGEHNEWVRDGTLYRYFVDPGSGDFEEISELQAEELAKRYGTTLEALSAPTPAV